jgi:hypothetical protein
MEGSQSTFGDPHPGDLLFMQAIYDDSNLEMDWLWLATNVTSNSQRRYCLQRALRINPHSRPAKRRLRAAQDRSSGWLRRWIRPKQSDGHGGAPRRKGVLIQKQWA